MAQAKESVFTTFGYSFHGRKVTVDQVFEEANLDFNVKTEGLVRMPQEALVELRNAIAEERPVDFSNWNPTLNNIVTSHKATFREDTGTTFGVVGSDYGVVQNREAMRFIDFVGEVSGQTPEIICAGALDYGSRIFVTTKLGDDMYLSDRDIITPYVVITTTHNGKGGVCAMVTPVRVVCQNTLNMALKSKFSHKIVIRHTSGASKRLDFTADANRQWARKLFEGTRSFTKDFLDSLYKLKEIQVDDEYTKRFMANLLKVSDENFTLWKKSNYNTDLMVQDKVFGKQLATRLSELEYSIYEGVGQEFYQNTALGLLNGATTWRQTHNTQRVKEGEANFLSKFEGVDANYTQDAYNLLVG